MALNRFRVTIFAVVSLISAATGAARAEIRAAIEHVPDAAGGFVFKHIPPPADNDAATDAEFSLVDGRQAPNGGKLAVLHDGRVPTDSDQPARNFFFQAGTDGGRFRIDLGRVVAVKQINTYSWHRTSRGPQVYSLYAAVGDETGFDAASKRGVAPTTVGWKRLVQVDTRPKDGDGGGLHGVPLSESEGVVGRFRYLLFDVFRTQQRDPFGNTFFSEIDVIDADGPPPSSLVEKLRLITCSTADAKYQFVIDASEAPDMAEWSEKSLKPLIIEWYPKIVELLPDEGFEAPKRITLRFRNDMGGTPASAAGPNVNLNARWMQSQIRGEARGAVVHELVHVVQSYSGRRTRSPNGAAPGWVVEGIADYIRWFLYEPQSRGAEITARNLDAARYDVSYRVSANFLDWLIRTYDEQLVAKLNSAARAGRYDEGLWKEWTGKTVQELGDEWKLFHARRIKNGR